MTAFESAGNAERPAASRYSSFVDASQRLLGTQTVPRRESNARLPNLLLGHLHTGWTWLKRRHALQASSRRLRLTETISLGDKRSVSIVQVDGAQFLIGSASGSVQLLAVLDKPQHTTQPGNEERQA